MIPALGRVSSPRFIGRRDELMALEHALGRTREGEGCGSLVFVGGEAGVGKSRLIAELAGRAERDGMAVVVGECLPLCEGELPYAPIVGALRSLLAHQGATELGGRLGSDREELAALASVGPSPGRFSLLLVNTAGAGAVTVAGLPPGAAVAVRESTEAAQQGTLLRPARVDGAGRLALTLAPRSVVTVVSR
jgi:hypothetical protein